jgi:hypothetical protein
MRDSLRIALSTLAVLSSLIALVVFTGTDAFAGSPPVHSISSINDPCTGALIPGVGKQTVDDLNTVNPDGSTETGTVVVTEFTSSDKNYRSEESNTQTTTTSADGSYQFYSFFDNVTIVGKDGSLNWSMQHFGDAVYFQGVLVDFRSGRHASPCH